MTDAAEGGVYVAGGLPARPFTIGLGGASNIAMTRMLAAFAALGIGVRGLYDNEPRRFRYWADSCIQGHTTNLDQLLGGDIDAMHISTRNDQHLAEAVAAAKAGKHILVEKPMRLTVVVAQTMIDAATHNNSSAADSVMTLIRYGPGSSGADRLAFAHASFTVAAPSSSDPPSPGLKACSLSRSPSQPSNPPPKAGPSKYPSCTNRKESTNV